MYTVHSVVCKKRFFTFILQDIIVYMYMHRALITFHVQELSEKAAVHVCKAREKLFNNIYYINEATHQWHDVILDDVLLFCLSQV